MSPPDRVAGFQGHQVYGGAGEWRYDHPDGTAVWVYPDPDSGSSIGGGTRSVEDAKDDIIAIFEGRPPSREVQRRREAREKLTRWDADAWIDYPDGEMVRIVDGAPEDEAFRRAVEWMRSHSGGYDDPFGFGGVSF